MKRLCIYLTYDKQGIVDKYIGYMLRELKTCVDALIVVCNQLEIVRGIDILEEYADEIYCRENIGFDSGGFKDALCNFIGWSKVLQYDELVLVNDSMFGPFKPMKVIFDEMEEKNVDFWGAAKHGEGKNNEIDYFPEHIQTYFLVIRSEMLHCKEFEEYWENMLYYTTFIESVKHYETKFTEYFSDLGYTFGTLADTEINDSCRSENNYMQYGMISYELIKKRNFPFLKKQQIVGDTLHYQTQENLWQAINYIDKETDYDVNFIWDNIIRSFHMVDLQRSLHLQYIISSEQKNHIEAFTRRIAILVFVSHRKTLEYVLEYLEKVDSAYTVKIIAENSEFLEDYRKWGFDCLEIRTDETVNLLIGFCDFDYVCVLHDVDMTSDIQPSCIGKSYFYNIWENLIKNKNHVSGILYQFESEARLGFLTSPQPNFAYYFGEYGKGWGGEFRIVDQLIEKLCLNGRISEHKEPFRITDNFWIRGCILKKLKNVERKNYPYLSYLWSYLAQDMGYYSGIVESSEYASMNEVNLQYYLSQIAFGVRQIYGDFETFSEMKEKVFFGGLIKYSKNYTKILVYGAGYMARKCKRLLHDVEAYVVSDGQEKPERIDGIPVRYLSEIVVPDDCGMVLCLNEENQKQVIPLLEDRGIKHYFCI